MAINPELHARLIARQTTAELERKAKKARPKGYWSQEEVDMSYRMADEWREIMRACAVAGDPIV